MIVRLTHAQWLAVKARITKDLQDAMLEHRRSIGKKTHEYLLPAVAWRRVLDQLTAVAYGPLGGKVEGGQTLYRAIQKIADAVGKIESHPALTVGRGVVGFHTEVIPVWQTDGGLYPISRSPYPKVDGTFTVLRPEHLQRRSGAITVWVPGSPDPHQVLHDPAFHLRLSGAPDLGAARIPELDGSGVE